MRDSIQSQAKEEDFKRWPQSKILTWLLHRASYKINSLRKQNIDIISNKSLNNNGSENQQQFAGVIISWHLTANLSRSVIRKTLRLYKPGNEKQTKCMCHQQRHDINLFKQNPYKVSRKVGHGVTKYIYFYFKYYLLMGTVHCYRPLLRFNLPSH